MQIVINVDNELYKYFSMHRSMQDDGYFSHVGQLIEAFRDGLPLPKGHGDLVDRNDLDGEWVCTYDSECVKECPCDKCSYSEYQCYTNIMDIPTIIEADKTESE